MTSLQQRRGLGCIIKRQQNKLTRGECVLFHMWTGRLDAWRLEVFYRSMSCYNRLNWSHSTHTHTHSVRAVSTWMDYIRSLTQTGCETQSSPCETDDISQPAWFTCLIWHAWTHHRWWWWGGGVQSLIKPDRDQLTLLTCLILFVPDGT